jgi:hypothetical protein
MKFVLLCEGPTEAKALPAFLKRWLDPQLAKPVGIKTVCYDGWSHLVEDAPKKTRLYFNRPQEYDIVAVIALLDLFGLTFFPPDKKTAKQRYEWAKEYLESKVSHPKFRQFFAVHETEAWLLSNPNLFPEEIKKAFPGKIQHPEEINFDEPPAKLLRRLYYLKTKRNYIKPTHGRELFNKLEPNLAYTKCPRLKELLDEMLKLAKEAGL